mgnify:CR=1 FL=1
MKRAVIEYWTEIRVVTEVELTDNEVDVLIDNNENLNGTPIYIDEVIEGDTPELDAIMQKAMPKQVVEVVAEIGNVFSKITVKTK